MPKKKAKKTTKKKVQIKAKEEWPIKFDSFSYRNDVVRYIMIGLTVFAAFSIVSILIILNSITPDINQVRLMIKVGGILGTMIMLYGLLLSFNHTQKVVGQLKNAYMISNVILTIIIAAFAAIIIML